MAGIQNMVCGLMQSIIAGPAVVDQESSISIHAKTNLARRFGNGYLRIIYFRTGKELA